MLHRPDISLVSDTRITENVDSFTKQRYRWRILTEIEGKILDTCRNCGEPIVFRHVDGILKPIHLNRGWCSAASSSSVSSAPFRSVDSYVNPNAYCPVCGEKVFYYQSRYGGRVFFDDLGWPWPKHPCTDNSNRALKTPSVVRRSVVIKDRHGQTLNIYYLSRYTTLLC